MKIKGSDGYFWVPLTTLAHARRETGIILLLENENLIFLPGTKVVMVRIQLAMFSFLGFGRFTNH